MDEWEVIVDTYIQNDKNRFLKAYHCAENLLETDLSDCEIDWFLDTLLREPVNLLMTIANECDNSLWSDAVSKAFKLLILVITKHPNFSSQHFESIVALCEQPFDNRTKQNAILCLTSVVRHSDIGARGYKAHIYNLETSKTCKAPYAELVGAICEHHPNLVKDQAINIWRVYLNLGSSNISDPVARSLLLGLNGLLNSFGLELPTAEFSLFYKCLISHRHKKRCKDVFLTLLERHVNLFREQVAADPRTREELWAMALNLEGTGPRPAILAVYEAIGQCVDDFNFQNILNAEVVPRVDSPSYVRYTALRVLRAAGRDAVCTKYDPRTLEHELRHSQLTYELAEAVLWRVEFNVEDDERLMKSALVFHRNLPEKYKKMILVHGLLQAPDDVRTALVTFFINEIKEEYNSEGNIDKYVLLWKSFFDTSDGEDKLVMQKCDLVLSDFMDHLVYTLECYVDTEDKLEELPESLRCILMVSSYLLPLAVGVDQGAMSERIRHAKTRMSQLLNALRSVCGDSTALLAASRALLVHADGCLFDSFTDIDINECADEAGLLECSLALIRTPLGTIQNPVVVLDAIQVILSRKDVEAIAQRRAIKILKKLLNLRGSELDKEISDVIKEVEKLIQRNDFKGKEGRALRRKALKFLGNNGRKSSRSIKNSQEENEINKYLTLDIPDVGEGIPIKVNLRAIHGLALKHQDPKVLQLTMELMSLNLKGRQLTEEEEERLARDSYALLRSHPHSHTRAFDSCDVTAARTLLQLVAGERSPTVRRAACVLAQEIALRTNTQSVVTHAIEMNGFVSKSAILDTSEMLINVLKENNTLVQMYLPDLIVRIANTSMNRHKALKESTDLFMEKIELFQEDVIQDLTLKLLKVILKQDGVGRHKMADVCQMKKMAENILRFLKDVNDYKGNDCYGVIRNVFVIAKQNGVDSSRLFYVLSTARRVFDLNEDDCRRMLNEEDLVKEKLFQEGQRDIDVMSVEGIAEICYEFAEILLESCREDTLKLLSNILTKLKPEQILQLNTSISTCFKKYIKLLKSTDLCLVESFESWCRLYLLDDIVKNLPKFVFPEKDVALASSLKLLLEIFDVTDPGFAGLKEYTMKLLSILHKYHSKNDLEKNIGKIKYFNDLFEISLRFMTPKEVKAEVKIEGFGEYMIPALFQYLIRKPYILVDQELAGRCGLLNDVVKYCVRKSKTEENCYKVLDLVDQLWPTYVNASTFKQKLCLLRDISSMQRKPPPDSSPMKWLVESIRSDLCSAVKKAKLIAVLPPGEDYKSTWSWFAGQLPARLAEVQGDNALLLGALLDALFAADASVLDSISQLVAGDTVEGWWDEAITTCMASLAAREDLSIYERLYERCWDGTSLGVCNRLMVPLLRCSKSTICEEFFSRKIESLVAMLNKIPRQVTAQYSYHKCVVDYTRALTLLKVIFEVLPKERIQSPKSQLYSQIAEKVADSPFYLVKVVASRCMALVAKNVVQCVDNNDLKLKNNCLRFHCEIYNCMAAAIWCQAPAKPIFYDYVFDQAAWTRAVDPDVEYNLPIKPHWQKSTFSRAVSVELDSSSSLLSRTSTRTRTFLHTLSENPLEFDVGFLQEDQEYRQEVSLSENPINYHPSAATITASLSRACHLPHKQWLVTTCTTLTLGLHRNVKWLVAQAICNCQKELQLYASTLRPALFKMIADTSAEEQVLNGLHVDVLDTIISWRDEGDISEEITDDVNVVIERLITTCIRNGCKRKTADIVLQRLDVLLEVYGKKAQIGWDCVTECIEVKNKDLAPTYLNIMKTITKRGLHVPELLPALLETLESGPRGLSLDQAAQLFGKAAAAAPPALRHQVTAQYRKLLRGRIAQRQEYIDLVYYAQSDLKDLCDDKIFEKISGMVFNVTDRNRSKCLQILSGFVSRCSLPAPSMVDELLEVPEVEEQVACGSADAMGLVRAGLSLMGEQLRTRMVTRAAVHCSSDVPGVRKAAYALLLAAFEYIFSVDQTVSNPKRAARFVSPLLQNEDMKTPFGILGLGLASDTAGHMRDTVSRCIGSSGTVRRFCECFIITVHLPAIFAATTTGNSSCLSTLLEVFFKQLRENDAFKLNLIGDHTAGGGLSTLKASVEATSQMMPLSNQEPIEEAKTLDQVLGALLKFSKNNIEAASSLCLQVMSSLKQRTSSGFDFSATMAELLVPMLGLVGSITPFVIEACRLFIDDCCLVNGFKKKVESLMISLKDTEGQELVEVLYEDLVIRLPGIKYFTLGETNEETEDHTMEDLSKEFTLEGLVEAFGKLSNWEDLTLQNRRSVVCSLPPLWVDLVKYREEMAMWKDKPSNTWFDKMAAVYHKETYKRMHWYNEMVKWPKSSFDSSAIVDALKLTSMQSKETPHNLTTHILPGDCLAKWSARILTRSACIVEMGEQDSNSATVSHALTWCTSANEMALSRQVLHCIDIIDKEDVATLPWLRQEIIARRQLALERNDMDVISSLLERTETIPPSLIQEASVEDVVGINHLALLLRCDLKELNKERLKYTLNDTLERMSSSERKALGDNRRVLCDMVRLAVTHYDAMWKDASDSEQNDLVIEISEVIGLALNQDLDVEYGVLVDVLLRRLNEFSGQLNTEATAAVLSKMENLIHVLDDVALNELMRNRHKLAGSPSGILSKLVREGEETDKLKMCLQLVADPKYSLHQYCKELMRALLNNDGDLWSRIFERMMQKIFENPYAGVDYLVLAKHQATLDNIREYDAENKELVKQTLMGLMREIASEPRTLGLTQLCPALTRDDSMRGSETEECLSRLLMLPRGVRLLKFEETVSFAASLRRPGILRLRTTSGHVRSFLVKCGERAQRDAAALRFVRILNLPSTPHYQVTPLGEDSGLIEYLEGHETLYSLVHAKDDVGSLLAPGVEEEVILKNKDDSLAQFQHMCTRTPAYVLRSAVEMRSSCFQDFITKKRRFEESLAVMTFVSSLLGLKDRHLENVLYRRGDGTVRCIDWNPVLQHGARELPPARLTRSLLALCRLPVLESRLRTKLFSGMGYVNCFLPKNPLSDPRCFVRNLAVSLEDVEDLMRGAVLSHQVTERPRLRNPGRYTHKYVEMLEEIFQDFGTKETYSVEEQVTDLLRHCTDPYILSVTRPAWMPWI